MSRCYLLLLVYQEILLLPPYIGESNPCQLKAQQIKCGEVEDGMAAWPSETYT